jgi:carbonic anhydrase/acetyltransferase-like protein (isoleucine patch superfamily)
VLGPGGILGNPPGFQAVRPNTPVLPFGAALSVATFIDPSTNIVHGQHTALGEKSYVGPYVSLNSATGYIKIGTGSDVLDNASIVSTPSGARTTPTSVLIGDQVSIGFGASVTGPSIIGAYADASKPTGIGANALIDGATIQPGAVVGALARVGPGVTVPTGIYVLPGANVTTNAEASNPALGKVESVPASVLSDLETTLTRSTQLAAGYTNLYQGNAATGLNLGVDPSATGVFNGDLAAVLGLSQEPGPTSSTAATGITFEPSRTGPKFPGPHKPSVEAALPHFHGRITGDARFGARVVQVQGGLGHANAFRADQGQPITFGGPPSTRFRVTINSPLGGTTTVGGVTKTVGGLSIGTNFSADTGAVVLGGPDTHYAFGDNVSIGAGAVVQATSMGSNVAIGARAYVSKSTLSSGTVIPPGTIMINNVVVRQIQW